MKVKMFGAARTVTGSCYRIKTEKTRFAIDYGMHQGNEAIQERNMTTKSYEPQNLDFILLTHAHIDHSGLLPKAAKDGFRGPIYCTEPTKALVEVMLLDSAHIQEKDAEWTSKKRARQNKPPVDPLYTEADAQEALKLLKAVKYNEISEHPNSGVRFTFRDAGHILGSSMIELEVDEKESTTKLIFSGDLGRVGALMMNEPFIPALKADYVFMESTYGDRNHKSNESSASELADAINYSYKNGEKTIIPAFAVERTQELLVVIKTLLRDKKIPQDIPIFIDSPLAIRATKIFIEYMAFLDSEITELTRTEGSPFEFSNITYTFDSADSQKLNTMKGPAIIISASGMCNAGRIRHHLRHNLWRSGASVVFVGYQAAGTPGRKIVDGAKTLTLLGEELSVAAKIYTIGGFSSHAGQDQLVSWIKGFARPNMQLFLTHGEDKAISALTQLLKQEIGIPIHIPHYLEEYTLLGQNQIQKDTTPLPKIDWDSLMRSARADLDKLELHTGALSTADEAIQHELYADIMDVRRRIVRLVQQ